jgi:hypothetical protein
MRWIKSPTPFVEEISRIMKECVRSLAEAGESCFSRLEQQPPLGS